MMEIGIMSVHVLYVFFIGAIILFMLLRKDTTFISLFGIFIISLWASHSLSASVSSLFHSFIYAASELLPTIFIICFIVSMSDVLTKTGINEAMISPFVRLVKGPVIAYWLIGGLMFAISLFFWPSPGVALIGAVLLPAASRAGLPPIAAAMAMNLFGHGFALSGDFVIQAAPKLTADAAGIPVGDVISASIPLVLIMGVTTTTAAFFMIQRERKKQLRPASFFPMSEEQDTSMYLPKRLRSLLALLIPLVFAADIACMVIFNLQGNDATALIGGSAICILLIVHFLVYKQKGLEKITGYFIEGFQFGFKVFGPVIPIAAFFYLGDSGYESILGTELPKHSHGIVNDLGIALSHAMPMSKELAAAALTAAGAVTGLDGSGFSGISLAGSIAKLFSSALHADPAVLTALGQISAIWVGGGTLIPWALIPAAAICKVDPFELARKNFLPVVIGLSVTTIAAMIML
ncbi:hypothetical protein [Bacillus halotolerans]|uniref:hypothetical protein n=1 Tax=Bacillus halotolerans TaxID=260554 RepID=UPI00187A0D45|nr:hypothetical protein [Bacillus halotolerans]QQF62672.1 hypothetical protein I9X38_20145 [Bacillus mojavensis]MCR6596025.1 hypothetical protein [Bacillus halotolerans]MDL5613359.1 hypothetical protein [Bacillus halotolerans]MEC0279536.1 hypothetical protein [Bacillus halotolerans]MEC1405888.1 hypothetical protein [Bacillus halotolerans]